MPAQIQSLPTMLGPAYIRTAEVTQVSADKFCRVRLEGGGSGQEISARLALPEPTMVQTGDRVLVAGESPTTGFIIGVLSSDPAQTVRTANGAGARVQGAGPDQCIAVHDRKGQIVFEYYPERGRSVVNTPQGDLQLTAPNGNIDLSAGKGVRCQGAEEVTLTARNSINIAVQNLEKHSEQRFQLDDQGADLATHRAKLVAAQGEVTFGRAVCRGQQLTSRINRARLVYGKLEISAKRLWERSEHAIRHVLDLCQIQAGRLRTLVKGAHYIQSERTTLLAKKDVRIDGEKINLG